MSRNQEFHNELGLQYGPGKPAWDTSHEALMREAMHSWVGSPDWMSNHIENVRSNSPAASAHGHAAANALLNELWDSPDQHTKTLYRGSRPDESPGIKSYTEKPHVAKKFAKKYGGDVVKIKAPVGLQMSRYITSSFDDSERQWLVDETDPRNKR